MILPIVAEHFEELDFLWEQREANLATVDWILDELEAHERRAEAHLAGLAMAELHAVDLARAALESGGRPEATAAGIVLCELGEPELETPLHEAFERAERPTLEGLVLALRHFASSDALGRLAERADGWSEEFPDARAALDELLAFRRRGSGGAEALIASEDPWLRDRGYGILARSRGTDDATLKRILEESDPQRRRRGLEAAARAGASGLAERCRSAAGRETDPDPVALAFLGVLGHDDDLPRLRAAVELPELAEAALEGLGAHGAGQLLEPLMAWMEDETRAPTALETYCRITGAEGLDGERPEPADEDDEQDERPLPDLEAVRTDWEGRRGAAHGGVRLQTGLEASGPGQSLPAEFDSMTLLARRDLLLRACATGAADVPDIELEARAALQRR